MRRHARLMMVAAGLAVAVSATAALWWVSRPPAPAASVAQDPATPLRQAAARQRDRLDRLPGDSVAWAALAMLHVQLARVTGDPQDLVNAEQAADRSLQARPAAANEPALTALAATAAARHDFGKAADLARQAVSVDAYSADAHGVHADALIELGDYVQGLAAVQRMLDLRPDTSSYARASYSFQLRGNMSRARELMDLAVTVASGPAELSFALQHQAELAIDSADRSGAQVPIGRALALYPDHPPVLIAAAKLAISDNDLTAAQTHLATACRRLPTAGCLILQAEVHMALGRADLAAAQGDLIRATAALSGADIETILYEADHGDTAAAVEQAQALYATRPSAPVADALAWALHRAGRSAEALALADAALRLGTKDALWLYHRGVIAANLGHITQARDDLQAALSLNPTFSLTHASAARAALAQLAGHA